MGQTPIKHTLAGYIIKKTDTEGYRSGKLTGKKHFNKIKTRKFLNQPNKKKKKNQKKNKKKKKT